MYDLFDFEMMRKTVEGQQPKEEAKLPFFPLGELALGLPYLFLSFWVTAIVDFLAGLRDDLWGQSLDFQEGRVIPVVKEFFKLFSDLVEVDEVKELLCVDAFHGFVFMQLYYYTESKTSRMNSEALLSTQEKIYGCMELYHVFLSICGFTLKNTAKRFELKMSGS